MYCLVQTKILTLAMLSIEGMVFVLYSLHICNNCNLFTGWSVWFPVWSTCVPDCGSPKCMADVKTPQPGTLEAALHHHCPLHHRLPSMGRQLRPSFRIRVRLLAFVRITAVHFFRSLRQTKEDRADMGVPFIGRFSFRGSGAPVLRDTGLRL